MTVLGKLDRRKVAVGVIGVVVGGVPAVVATGANEAGEAAAGVAGRCGIGSGVGVGLGVAITVVGAARQGGHVLIEQRRRRGGRHAGTWGRRAS